MSLIRQSAVQSFLDALLKESGRLRTGNNLQYHCPFCFHEKRKLEICLDDPGYWHCWTCNSKGRGYFSLLKKLHAAQSKFDELEKIVGIRTIIHHVVDENKPLISFDEQKETEESIELDLPENFVSLAYNDGSMDYRRAINYARKRKITSADIVKYNIGYCSKGRYQHRLIFPSYDKENKLNFFSTRSYFDDAVLKYINSTVSKNIIGFENLIDFDYPIYLCEGALDAISLKRNAIPLFGKTLSQKLKSAIIESKCSEINVVLDDDALQSALAICDFIKSIGKNAKLVTLLGKDPNVLGFEKTMDQIRNTSNLDFRNEMKLKLGL